MAKKWTDETREAEIRKIAAQFDHFPTASELRAIFRNDLAVQIGRSGGFAKWAERLGMAVKESDSGKGWAGESLFRQIAAEKGFACTKPDGVKSPFDLILDGVLRVDVKTAKFAAYGPWQIYSVGHRDLPPVGHAEYLCRALVAVHDVEHHHLAGRRQIR